MMSELPTISFETEAAWTEWLESNHVSSRGVWLKIAKKGSDYTTITYHQALDIALWFGWIDGQRNKFDDQFFLQKFTPRRPKSSWSRINREKVEAFTAEGKMREAGLKEVDAARADGRWDSAYESQSRMTVPEDFQAALDDNPEAQAFFSQLNGTNRYAILYSITTAKKPETRQRRIEKFIAMLNAKEKIYG
jgi:uncharacterized protein YdeI (YjbR/CyaY-like superfamily)